MRKIMDLTPVTFSFPTPTRWNVHLLSVTQSVACPIQIETELNLNEFLMRIRD